MDYTPSPVTPVTKISKPQKSPTIKNTNLRVRSNNNTNARRPANQPPLCLDFVNGKCTRMRNCKYYHPTLEEIGQQKSSVPQCIEIDRHPGKQPSVCEVCMHVKRGCCWIPFYAFFSVFAATR